MTISLINNLKKLKRIIDNNDQEVIDLSQYSFLAPPLLLPLL